MRVFLLLVLIVTIGGYVWIRSAGSLPFISNLPISSLPGLATSTPAPTATPSAADYFDRAEQLYAEGKLSAAIAEYQTAIAREPSEVRYYVPLIRLLVLRDRLAEALEQADLITTLIEPESAAAHAVRAMVLDWSGRPEEAVGAARHAVELDPNYAEGYAYLAEALADLQRMDEAEEKAAKAIALDPRSAVAQRNLGYVYEREGRYAAAVTQYQLAIAIQPRLSYLYIDVGRNQRVLGNWPAARAAFEQAVTLDPDNAQAQYDLGLTYYAEGDPASAIDPLKKATELNPRATDAFVYLGMAYFRQHNYEDAIIVLEHAANDLGASTSEAYYALGLSYYFLEDCDRAVPWFYKMLELVPDDKNALDAIRLCEAPLPTRAP